LALVKAAKTMREFNAPKVVDRTKTGNDRDSTQFAERYGPGVGHAAAAGQRAFSRAFGRIEGELYDMVRAARLAENALHEAVGNLDCAHEGEAPYVEVPNYEQTQLAEFALGNVVTTAKFCKNCTGVCTPRR